MENNEYIGHYPERITHKIRLIMIIKKQECMYCKDKEQKEMIEHTLETDVLKDVNYICLNCFTTHTTEIFSYLYNKMRLRTSFKLMFIENNNSVHKFWELFDKLCTNLVNMIPNKQDVEDHGLKFRFESAILRFIERLPSGNYSNIREEWNLQET